MRTFGAKAVTAGKQKPDVGVSESLWHFRSITDKILRGVTLALLGIGHNGR